VTGHGRGRFRGAPNAGAVCPDGEGMGAFLAVAVHECSQGGVACCWNWSEAGHMLAELGDEMSWIHWFGSLS
jgi:hypothetical protein